MKVWNELQWQRVGLVVSTCEKGNEISDYNKKEKFEAFHLLGR